MQPCPDPRLRLIFAHLERASDRLDLRPDVPPGNEGARQCRICEIDREGVIQYATRPRRRHGPPVRTAVLIKPGGYLRMPLADTLRRNVDRAQLERRAP